MMIRIGIADCHGIESYLSEDEAKGALFALQLRVRANRYRHSVAFNVEIDSKADEAVSVLIDGNDYKGALEVLKESAETVGLIPTDSGVERSWNMIPNDNLDPYYVPEDSED
jgi:hypothetical protein